MKLTIVSVLFFHAITTFALTVPQKYFVAFTDKNGTPFSISNPQAFLTQRAIDRRTRQGIPVIAEDLPVNPAYVTAVAATGVQVFTRCKWFNGIIINVPDSSVLPAIRALSFVQSVTRVTAYNSKKSKEESKSTGLENFIMNSTGEYTMASPGSVKSYDYGPSYKQIHLENGDVLHNLGFRGAGMVIAQLDIGFLNVDINTDFSNLWANNQILGTRDFVSPGGDVFRDDNHGAAVFSTMACNNPGDLIGTAPEASYWLIRTDDVNTENIVEEYYWVAGAEMADSVGADIISSSLAYTTFNNNWMNHTCDDMNGYTNPSTRGANIAASKGIAISISAGNSGGSGWTCVGSPSDARDALCVGAVDSLGHYASFSSTGTVNGTYVKPNIAAMGVDCRIASPDNSFGYSSGTSFSAPINAGLMACLWQARPDIDQYHLRLAIEESASQYTQPDSLLGYGIPDYQKAILILGAGAQPSSTSSLRAYPNPFRDYFTLALDKSISGESVISLLTVTGSCILETRKTIRAGGEDILTFRNLGDLAPGCYFLKISDGKSIRYISLVKI